MEYWKDGFNGGLDMSGFSFERQYSNIPIFHYSRDSERIGKDANIYVFYVIAIQKGKQEKEGMYAVRIR